MKNIAKNSWCFLLVLLLACSGEEFLDETKPGNNRLPDFQSNLELENTIRAAYFNLGSPRPNGSTLSLMGYQDVVTDLVELKAYSQINQGDNNRYMGPIYRRIPEINDLRWLEEGFQGAYQVMLSANTVLDFYDNNEPFSDNPQRVPGLRGEGYFLRALANYTVVSVFSPPYSSDPSAPGNIIRTTPPEGPIDLPGRSTVEETYNLIIGDLKQAIDLLPETFEPSRDPDWIEGSGSKDAARFLLARVYFHMGPDFWISGFDGDGGALQYIDEVISGGRHSVDNYTDLRSAIYAQRGLGNVSAETIWQVSYYFRNGWRVPQYNRFYSALNGATRGFAFSKAILNEIGWNDTTVAVLDQRYNDLFRRYEADGSGSEGADPRWADSYTDSYNVWAIDKYRQAPVSYPIFRLPEMHLTRALIRFENGDATGAAEDLNVTRGRAGLTPLVTATLQDIDDEWVKEMAFEHRRLAYLQAQLRDIPPGDRTGTGPIPYDDPSLVRDMPFREVTRNPNVDASSGSGG